MPPNVRQAILQSSIDADARVRAFWVGTMSPDEVPLELDRDAGDFQQSLASGSLDDALRDPDE